MAERVGFEPTNTVRCYTLSRRAPSTARPPLHKPQSAPNRRVGLTRALPGPRPAGALRASKIAPAILSNPRTRLGVTHFPGVRLRPLGHLSTRAARVPEAAPAIKSVGTPGPRLAHLPRGGRLVRRSRLVTGRYIQASVLGSRRRRRQLDGGNHECVLGIRRIQAFRDLERRHLHSLLIFLSDMTIRVQPPHDVAA